MVRFILVLAISTSVPFAHARWDDAPTGSSKPSPSKTTTAFGRFESAFNSLKSKVQAKITEFKKAPTSPTATAPRAPANSTPTTAPAAPEVVEMTPSQKEFIDTGKAAKQNLNSQPLFTKTGEPLKIDRKKFAIPKGKVISRIDLGTEPSLTRRDFTMGLGAVENLMKPPAATFKRPLAKADPKPLLQAQGIKIGQANIRTLNEKEWKIDKPVTRQQIEKTAPNLLPDNPNANVMPVVDIQAEDLLFLAIQIENDKKGRCHLTMGMAQDLLNSKTYADEAKFQIGRCAAETSLHNNRKKFLVPLVKEEHPTFYQQAVVALTKGLTPSDYDDVGGVLAERKDQNTWNEGIKDEANYIIARNGYDKGLYQRTINYGPLVSKKSPFYLDAQMLVALSQFNKGEEKEAQKTMLALRKHLVDSGNTDKKIETLVALSMARFYFATKNYESAIREYRAVDKSHPAWVQSMVELGWAQIAMGDFAGAIGNMYSMHSPFFEAVFKPETYAIRAIGYLNICQYGDAYKTMTALEGIHKQWTGAISQYLQIHKAPGDYYQTVRTYLKSGQSKLPTDGLPYQVVREMARQRNFLNVQTVLNEKIDEKAQLDKVGARINQEIASARYRKMQAQQRLAGLKVKLQAAKTNKALIQNINGWEAERRNEEKLVDNYDFQANLYAQAKKSYDQLKRESLNRISGEESALRTTAGVALRQNLKEMDGQLRSLFENNEFLRFEIFAGSGENIRYQVAGGEVAKPNRIPSYVRPQKIMDWQFDGEYWADEIGSYRSSLTNNCPSHKRAVGQHDGGN